MAIYPGATKRLINTDFLTEKPIVLYNRVNLHVQAGTGSLYNFFNQPKKPSSHFWVSYKGLVEQYVDTSLRAEADLEGNDATISIETEGGTGSNADKDPWTPEQITALVALVGWILETHKIPKKLAENSFSGDERSKGISWHRLGVDGNFPALPDIRAGRIQRGGGMHYSVSRGKICPGGGKIQQIPGILDQILGGTPAPIPPTPTPTPPKPQPKPPATGKLKEDGLWGNATTEALQKYFKTPVDGEIWGQMSKYKQPAYVGGWIYNYPNPPGSQLIKAMQKWLAVKQDGIFGTDSIKALQKKMGTGVDGKLDKPSPCVKELQKRLNKGKL